MEREMRAAEVFPPGEFLREELEARGWTQADLAAIVDSSTRHVNELVASKRSITPETARRLAEAFGTSAEMWMRLESDYQLSKTGTPDDRIAKRSRLYARAPIAEMARRGWIEASSDVDYLDRQVRAFLGINDLAERPNVRRVAARAHHEYTIGQEAWLRRAIQVGRVVAAGKYSVRKLDAALEKLQGFLQDAENVRLVPHTLAEAGVRFVVVEHTKGSKIDGAAIWLDRSTPVVALSMRYDKLDSFWHTLMHELGHLKLQHGDFLDVSLFGPDADRQARTDADEEADRFAEEQLVPRKELSSFFDRNHPLYSKTTVEGFAARLGVHPSIVLGQLKHKGKMRWQNFAAMHPRVRGIVTAAALCDGWGQQLSIGRLEP